jgi:cytochrome c oxidase assembly protein subunit 15
MLEGRMSIAAGGRMASEPAGTAATPGRPSRLPHALTLAAAVLTWPLLLVGGSVTVYRVGMAVPDWPTTFGVNMFLYDFLHSSWGVFIEHSHRLYGAAVGLACLTLALAVTFAEFGPIAGTTLILAPLAAGLAPAVFPVMIEGTGLGPVFGGLAFAGLSALGAAIALGLVLRRPVVALSWLALAAVIGQGVLGGYRVRWNSPTLAFIHGCTAQAFFALLVVLCVRMGRGWSAPDAVEDSSHLRRRSAVTLLLVYAQIVLGAWVRHHGEWRAVVVHAIIASAVWGHALALAVRVLRNDSSARPALVPSTWAMIVLATLQVLVGAMAWWVLRPFDGIARSVWPAQALVRIAHQGLGALMLASVVVLTLRTFRSLRSPVREVTVSGTRLEAVA